MPQAFIVHVRQRATNILISAVNGRLTRVVASVRAQQSGGRAV